MKCNGGLVLSLQYGYAEHYHHAMCITVHSRIQHAKHLVQGKHIHVQRKLDKDKDNKMTFSL